MPPNKQDGIYRPGLFFRNGQVNTIYAGLCRNAPDDPLSERIRVDTPDGDFLDVDGHFQGADRLLVVLHGLEGSSRRPYMRYLVRCFFEAGWDVVALNFRGCSGEPNRLLRSYHSGETGDLRFLLDWLARQYAHPQVVVAGFSLGGNVVLKFLGEEGEGCYPRIKAGIGFSVPVQLAAVSRQLDQGWNRLYVRRFLRTLVPRAREKARRFPGVISMNLLDKVKTLKAFDDAVTAPVFGFEDALDYWAKASSGPWLDRIAVPALLVNALDDPFLGDGCYPLTGEHAPGRLEVETPRYGGHVAFARWTRQGYYWSEQRILAFAEAALNRSR